MSNTSDNKNFVRKLILNEAYTSDDSIHWYEAAIKTKKITNVSFI